MAPTISAFLFVRSFTAALRSRGRAPMTRPRAAERPGGRLRDPDARGRPVPGGSRPAPCRRRRARRNASRRSPSRSSCQVRTTSTGSSAPPQTIARGLSSARPPATKRIASSGSRPYQRPIDRRPQKEHDAHDREGALDAETRDHRDRERRRDDPREVVDDVVDAEHASAIPVGDRLLHHRVHGDLLPRERESHGEAREQDGPVPEEERHGDPSAIPPTTNAAATIFGFENRSSSLPTVRMPSRTPTPPAPIRFENEATPCTERDVGTPPGRA